MDFMLSVISDYDYRSSKHYAENSEYAAKLSAVILKFTRSGIFSYDQSGDYLGTKKPSELTVKRRIFPGIVIDSSLVSSLSVRYYPLHCDESVRLRTASIVKYIENKLRAIYCIRNRLSNVNISSDQKSPIDAFFSRIHSVSNKPVEKLLSLDTEKQEVNKKVTVDINIEKAKNIELSSWDTTKKLTEAFDDSGEMLDFAIIPSIDSFDAEDECDTPQEDYECDSADEFATFASEITPLQKEILLFLLSDNKAAARTSAISAGSFLEAEVDLINSAAADIIRDIVIEQTLDITGDYISDLLRVLQS
ncbi:hypothetical protein SDC9_147811 [bioreactor metagenome]|uniref:TerB-C domain-containing protein n=1 Tax=bioreactor metagenome TaxID=1076179 RepID=A0A645EEZ4_9ZZZZ